MAEALDLSSFVERGEAGTAHMTLAVEGVGCAGCIRKIEGGLAKLPGVIDARLNFTQRRLAVDWRDGEIDAAQIVKALEAIGYRAHPFAPERVRSGREPQAKWLLKCLAVAGFAAMNVMLLSISVWSGNVSDMTQETRDLFHWLSALIALPAAAYAGQPFFQSAWRALRARQLNMDVPISVGVILALGLSVVRDRDACRPAPISIPRSCCCSSCCAAAISTRRCGARRGCSPATRFVGKAEFAHRLDDKRRSHPRAGRRAGARRPRAGAARRSHPGRRRHHRWRIGYRREPGDWRDHAARRSAPARPFTPEASTSAATLAMRVTAAGAGTLVEEVERLLQKASEAKSRTVRLADRAARLYAPVVHVTAALTRSAG